MRNWRHRITEPKTPKNILRYPQPPTLQILTMDAQKIDRQNTKKSVHYAQGPAKKTRQT